MPRENESRRASVVGGCRRDRQPCVRYGLSPNARRKRARLLLRLPDLALLWQFPAPPRLAATAPARLLRGNPPTPDPARAAIGQSRRRGRDAGAVGRSACPEHSRMGAARRARVAPSLSRHALAP